MDATNTPPTSTKNQTIANQTTIFFKGFKLSAIIAIIVFILMWAAVYQVPRPIDPKIAGGSYSHFDRLCRHSFGEVYDPSYVLSSSDAMLRAKKTWAGDKTVSALIISLVVFIGLPFGIILVKGISTAKTWVDENKTI